MFSTTLKLSQRSFFSLIAIILSMVINTSMAASLISNSLTEGRSSRIPISLNFQDIKVRTILQLLAQLSGLDIIVSEAVTGSITLNLENTPWDQALNIILQSQGLGMRSIGKVLLVAPINEIATREKQILEANQQLRDLAPLTSALIQINYGKAADLASLLKGQGSSLLSTHGTVSVDARTNTLWIQETAPRLLEIRQFVRQLDIPVKQVLIEARIVNIDCNFSKELGIRYNLSGPVHTSFMHGSFNSASGNEALNQRLNIDLPTPDAYTINSSSAVGLALGHLGKDSFLDLELSALESEGGGQIISCPRLITADQQTAQIQAGEEIPYQQSTSSGATSVSFKEAVLSLNVTPQITPDGKIIMTLKVNQDKVGSHMVQNVPTIDTRAIETQVLVEDGETVVLGGIYETDNNHQVRRVPFLGSLPLIGALFRQSITNKQRKELVIFVTPHIIGETKA